MHSHMHAAQADEAAQEFEPEALGPEAATSTATAWPCEAATASPFVPETTNGLCAQGLGAPGRLAGPSMAAVGGLVNGSAGAVLHAPAEAQHAERQPEPAQAGHDRALAGPLADEHAAPATLPAPVQPVASSLVRARCIPAFMTPESAATTCEHEGGIGCCVFGGCIAAVRSCQGASHDDRRPYQHEWTTPHAAAKDTDFGKHGTMAVAAVSQLPEQGPSSTCAFAMVGPVL